MKSHRSVVLPFIRPFSLMTPSTYPPDPSDASSESRRDESLQADQPEPFAGNDPPDVGDVPNALTDAEREAMELDDDDLDLVSGGLSRPRELDDTTSERVFRRRPPQYL